ncbi:MAG: hypothetical protein K2X27_16720, partial [Candidatus Obscuribacterales bacterium]|nr:hypothetical protein [Candidatus Obscuribacterales bacterium]
MSNNNVSDRANEPAPEQKVGIFWLIVAFFVNVLFWQPMKWLIQRAYKETSLTRAISYSTLGALVSILAGIFTSYHVGWQLGHSALGWVPAGVFATFATFIYAWCPVLIWVYKPAEKASDWLWKRVRINSDSKYVPYKPAKPVSEDDANKPQEEDKTKHLTWFSYLLVAACYLTGIAGFSYLGWSYTHESLNYGPEWLSWVVWSVVGIGAFCVSTGKSTREDLYGRMECLAFTTGVLACYASAPYVSLLGLGGWSWLVYLVEMIAFCGLVFPALHTFISECFYWAYKAVEKLAESTYSEKDRDYKTFFAEALNVVLAVGAGYSAFHLFGQLALPVVALVALAIVAAVLSYRIVGEILLNGTILSLGLSTGVLIRQIWLNRQELHQLSGLEMSDSSWVGVTVAACVLAALVNFFVLLPLVYISIRFLARDILHIATRFGAKLKLVHDVVDKKFESLLKVLRTCYNDTYVGDRQDSHDKVYRNAFVQVLNIVQTVVLTVAAAWSVTHYHAGVVGIVAAAVVGWVSAVFLYVFCGKILIESGVRLVGHIVGAAVGVALGAYIHLSA